MLKLAVYLKRCNQTSQTINIVAQSTEIRKIDEIQQKFCRLCYQGRDISASCMRYKILFICRLSAILTGQITRISTFLPKSSQTSTCPTITMISMTTRAVYSLHFALRIFDTCSFPSIAKLPNSSTLHHNTFLSNWVV